jgi:SAM-dependent methyltransferase
MGYTPANPPGILATARQYWNNLASRNGPWSATTGLLRVFWEFARDSTPERQRLRFGDADYDWDHRVNTTSGAVGWRDRLLGGFHSAYQPTEPAHFHEMLDSLQQSANLNFADYVFLDLGSGKGRTLLMASDYPFQRIIGVELLPALHSTAQANLAAYKSDSQKCFALESVCADATNFSLPAAPLIIYLFNPFPERGLRLVLSNIEKSLAQNPRPIYALYLNPELEYVLAGSKCFRKIGGTHQYSLFRSSE